MGSARCQQENRNARQILPEAAGICRAGAFRKLQKPLKINGLNRSEAGTRLATNGSTACARMSGVQL
jgi:hypothetical protein